MRSSRFGVRGTIHFEPRTSNLEPFTKHIVDKYLAGDYHSE